MTLRAGRDRILFVLVELSREEGGTVMSGVGTRAAQLAKLDGSTRPLYPAVVLLVGAVAVEADVGHGGKAPSIGAIFERIVRSVVHRRGYSGAPSGAPRQRTLLAIRNARYRGAAAVAVAVAVLSVIRGCDAGIESPWTGTCIFGIVRIKLMMIGADPPRVQGVVVVVWVRALPGSVTSFPCVHSTPGKRQYRKQRGHADTSNGAAGQRFVVIVEREGGGGVGDLEDGEGWIVG